MIISIYIGKETRRKSRRRRRRVEKKKKKDDIRYSVGGLRSTRISAK